MKPTMNNENADPDQCHNHAKIESSRFNSVQEKVNIKFFSSEVIQSIFFLEVEHVQNSRVVVIHDQLDVINNRTTLIR